MASQPDPPRATTAYFDSLLDRIRAGDGSAKAELIRDAYGRALELTRAILQGSRAGLPRGHTEPICGLAYEDFARRVESGMIVDFGCIRQAFAYLGKVVTTAAIDEARRQFGVKGRTQFPGTAFDESTHRAAGPSDTEAEQRLRFWEMIEPLPADDQLLLSLTYRWDFNDTEIARICGWPRRSIEPRRVAILLGLRRLLDA